MESKDGLEYLLLFSFALVFPVFWMAMCWFLSATGGWRKIAKHYPAVAMPAGQKYSMQSAKIGLTHYNNCLTIYFSEQGLYIVQLWFMKTGHAPIFIPWDAMVNPTEKRILWTRWIEFDIGSPSLSSILLPEKLIHRTSFESKLGLTHL